MEHPMQIARQKQDPKQHYSICMLVVNNDTMTSACNNLKIKMFLYFVEIYKHTMIKTH